MNDLSSSLTDREIGTHVTHCCLKHGCKYGYDYPREGSTSLCPVSSGKYTQEYPCEYCIPVEQIEAEISQLQEELEWSKKIYKSSPI